MGAAPAGGCVGLFIGTLVLKSPQTEPRGPSSPDTSRPRSWPAPRPKINPRTPPAVSSMQTERRPQTRGSKKKNRENKTGRFLRGPPGNSPEHPSGVSLCRVAEPAPGPLPVSKSPITIYPEKSARKSFAIRFTNMYTRPRILLEKRENSREAACIVAGIRDSVKFCCGFCCRFYCLFPFKVCVL